MSHSLLNVFLTNCKKYPDSDFLVEDNTVSLSYLDAYVVMKLLPNQLYELHPTLATMACPKVVILSHNNALVPLSILALWTISAKVILLSTSSDPSLWSGMINLVDPDLILVSPGLQQSLTKSLQGVSLYTKYSFIIDISTLIPGVYATPITSSATVNLSNRLSNYIPSLRSWVNQAFRESSSDDITGGASAPSVGLDIPAITLFTSSAIDWSSLKCVTYTHGVLAHSARRAMLMLGGSQFSSQPKRHLGWLPLSHCFEFCITFCGVVLQTAGTYIFFDRFVSSPRLPPTTTIAALLLASLKYYNNITATTMTPSVFGEVLGLCRQDDISRLQALDSLGIGGAPTVESVFQWAASRNIPYFDCSGATEAAGTIAIRRAWDFCQRGNGLEIIPEFMGILEKENLSDNYGELVIQCTHLPKGYDFRDSASYSFDPLTGVTTYRTGDLYSHPDHISTFSYIAGEQIPPYDINMSSMSGLTYIGRIDDLVVFESGVKIDALALERVLDSRGSIIKRSAILSNVAGDSLVALIQPHSLPLKVGAIKSMIDAVLDLNISIPFEKRIRRELIFIVNQLPVTTKQTLNRKKLKKMFTEIGKDEDIPHVLHTPPSVMGNQEQKFKLELGPTYAPQELRSRISCLLSQVYSIPERHFAVQSSSLADIPLTSLSAVQLAKALKDQLSTEVTAAQLYGVHNVDDLCALICASASLQFTPPISSLPPHIKSENIPNETRGDTAPEISITGCACRFVGNINSLDDYWSALLAPDVFVKNLKRERPPTRWGRERMDDCSGISPMGWLEDSAIQNLKSFANFFGLSPMEASNMSPNARLALQLGYLAIEDACIAPCSLNGQNWGIFTCVNDSGWREHRLEKSGLEEYAIGMHGSSDDAVGARLSYFLNLTGLSIEIKTACSSSAVAIHQACSAIRNGDCEAAIVISSTTHFHPAGAIFRSHNGIVSPSGVCAPFSVRADGFVASEGAAAIVLQRASDARVYPYGSVVSSAITQDGASRGFFAPNPKAQSRLLCEALSKASLLPNQISFFEAHGTGTQLGDAIELQSIKETFAEGLESNRTNPLFVGSSKAVIGHTEECAGLAGVLKVLSCFTHNAIPPQPPSGPLNEIFTSSASQLQIPRKISPFLPSESRRLCSISSFGLSGTLAHIIIGETIKPVELHHSSCNATSPEIFLVSAYSADDLSLKVKSCVEFFTNQHLTQSELDACARTSQLARDHLPARAAWTVHTWQDLIHGLQQYTPKLFLPSPLPPTRSSQIPRIGIWFGLPFSRTEVVNNHRFYQSILAEMSDTNWDSVYATLKDQVVIARCLLELGCEISTVGGAGMAEYAAGVFAGTVPAQAVFRVTETETKISTHVVRCAEAELKEYVMEWRSDQLRIVDQHSANLFTIAGNSNCVEWLVKERRVELSSPLPAPTILMPVGSFRPSSVPIISAHTGGVLDEETLTSFNYWNSAQRRDCDSRTALNTLKSHCDIVVNLSHVEDFLKKELEDGFISIQGNSLERIVAALFQQGCSIKWSKFSSQGPLFRIPGSSWSPDA